MVAGVLEAVAAALRQVATVRRDAAALSKTTGCVPRRGTGNVDDPIQRALPLHRQLGPLDPRRSHAESPGAGRGRFRAYSAGSQPKGGVNPLALELLREQKISTEALRSKSWDEFAGPDAPALDFVFTVCDNAAAEVCPIWPGQPMTAHWGVPDPAAVEGTDEAKRKAFRDALFALRRRIELFANLPFDKLSRLALQDACARSAASERWPSI